MAGRPPAPPNPPRPAAVPPALPLPACPAPHASALRAPTSSPASRPRRRGPAPSSASSRRCGFGGWEPRPRPRGDGPHRAALLEFSAQPRYGCAARRVPPPALPPLSRAPPPFSPPAPEPAILPPVRARPPYQSRGKRGSIKAALRAPWLCSANPPRAKTSPARLATAPTKQPLGLPHSLSACVLSSLAFFSSLPHSSTSTRPATCHGAQEKRASKRLAARAAPCQLYASFSRGLGRWRFISGRPKSGEALPRRSTSRARSRFLSCVPLEPFEA